jgi:hypothetical protein
MNQRRLWIESRPPHEREQAAREVDEEASRFWRLFCAAERDPITFHNPAPETTAKDEPA